MAASVRCEELIVALDAPDLAAARRLVEQVGDIAGTFKVGLELFTAAGPAAFDALRAGGAARIFYDAKLCDIPNTVAGAARVAARHRLWFLTIHALGGLAAMRAARQAAEEGAASAGCDPPRLLAITLLTSLDDREVREELGLRGSVAVEVLRLAELTRAAGLAGVVASSWEAEAIRAACGPDFIIVTPGIRPAADGGSAPAATARHDQKRVMTPAEAIRAGADYLVIGRAISAAPDPRAAAVALAAEIAAARSERH
jgi:orotidine-5'-phosphate decarboxylase